MSFNFKLLLAVFLSILFSQISAASEVVIEHVANAGIKISSGNKTVLIDALFGPHKYFNSLGDSEFEKLVKQGADVALATHDHSDHFGAKRTLEFLQSNPDTLFIGTPAMLSSLSGKANTTQLASASLKNYESEVFAHNQIEVEVLNFPHMDPHPEQATNFGYLVDINGWKILHVGDADVNAEVIKGLKLADKNIDVALIHDLFVVRKENYLELIKKMNADKVAFVHMTDDKAKPMASWLKQNLPHGDMLVTGYERIELTRKPSSKQTK